MLLVRGGLKIYITLSVGFGHLLWDYMSWSCLDRLTIRPWRHGRGLIMAVQPWVVIFCCVLLGVDHEIVIEKRITPRDAASSV